MQMAFYWASNNSVEKESDYKYTAKDGTCKESEYTGLYKTAGGDAIKGNSSSALMASIQAAPTSVAIEADKAVF